MFPLTNFTAPVGSAVLPFATNDATRFEASFSGGTRLNGCEPVNVVPNESMPFIVPRVGIVPYTYDDPTPTVPSWQLRQRLLVTPSVGCVFPCSGYVVLLYGTYVACDNF